MLISSAVSTPVDTAVFLLLISGLTTGTFILMVLSKMVAAGVVWWYYHRRLSAMVATNGYALAEDYNFSSDDRPHL